MFAQLQGLFAQLALSKATFAGPHRFWAAFKDYDGTPIDIREHQDAYEFFTRLQVRAVWQLWTMVEWRAGWEQRPRHAGTASKPGLLLGTETGRHRVVPQAG